MCIMNRAFLHVPLPFRLTRLSNLDSLMEGASVQYAPGMYLFDADQSCSRDLAGKERRDGVEALAPPTKLLEEPPAPRTIC